MIYNLQRFGLFALVRQPFIRNFLLFDWSLNIEEILFFVKVNGEFILRFFNF